MAQSRVVICGVGLIGGSFALALKKSALALRRDLQVVGLGRTRAPLEQALQLGVIDAIATDWASALDGADLVLLGMPVGQMPAVMQALAPHLQPHTIVTDGGSTKSDVVAAARVAFGDKIGQFVPGHPIAGAEKSGVAAAQADLYVDKRVVLTPLPENSAADVKAVRAVWELCGAKLSQLAADEHDRVFAAVSHLPHLLAFAMMHSLQGQDQGEQYMALAGSGFRDFTRIAASEPAMWRDILLANRDELLAQSRLFQDSLQALEQLITAGDAAQLHSAIRQASESRASWAQAAGPSSPHQD